MKRIAIGLLATCVAAAATAQTPAQSAPPSTAPQKGSFPANVRVAVIDVERLVRDSALGKEAFARLKRINDNKKGDAEKLAKEIREMEQKLADQGASLADDKKEALQKQYQERAIAFKRFQDDAQRQLEEAQKKELQQLEGRVMPVITQVGKERGFAMIFNKFQSGLVYADEASDVTDEVLKRFNTIVAVPGASAATGDTKPKVTPKKPS